MRGVLASIHDPETGRNLVAAGQVRAVDVTGERVAVTVGLTSFAAPLRPEIEQTIRERLATALPDGTPVDLTITDHKRIATPVGQVRIPAKAIVAVGSGKGGVGKSTVAASIARNAPPRRNCRGWRVPRLSQRIVRFPLSIKAGSGSSQRRSIRPWLRL